MDGREMIANDEHELSGVCNPAFEDFSDPEVMQAMLAHDLTVVLMRKRCYLRWNVMTAMMDQTKADAAAVDVGIEVA